MKYIKYFESSITSKINFDVISDIESLSVDYLDEGLSLSISVNYGDLCIYYKNVSHINHQSVYILPDEAANKLKIDNKLVYKFMLYWAVSDEEIETNHMAEDDDNIEDSEKVLHSIKSLYPDEYIELNIYDNSYWHL